jgi:hypothetical protein
MRCCPNCRRPWPEAEQDPIADRVDQLRQWLRSQGQWVGPSDAINEQAAALALGLSASTLHGWRHTDQKLPFTKVGGRVRYLLADIATFAAGKSNC